MKPMRIAALVLGCLLIVPAAAMFIGGGVMAAAYAFGRDDDGYFDLSVDRLESDRVAITAEDLDLTADPGTPNRLFDLLDVDVRLRVTGADSATDVFVGIALESDVDAYLSGVGHDEIRDLDDGGSPSYRQREGGDQVGAPAAETFWNVSATGPGTQEVEWEAAEGRWAVVLMNADGSPGVAVDTDVGVRAGFVVPLSIILLAVGAVLSIAAVGLIVAGASSARRESVETPDGAAVVPQPVGAVAEHRAPADTPVTLEGNLDVELSRWQWLVKWILAIPHAIVLFFLWIAFAVLTVVAGIAILFTGRYPRGIFDFNVGVLRWSWRVSYYAASGGIGTDQYPPFSLEPDPTYPASLDVAYPDRLSRGLVLVKWWLLAIPHYFILALIAGGSVGWTFGTSDNVRFDPAGGAGLLGVLVVIAGVILLFSGRYPRPLFDLIVGLNRWVYRVVAYAALMTDRYPPFRLDQGGSEIGPVGPDPQPPEPISSAAEIDERVGV